MTNSIGIMQGRLSPDLNGYFQFFPENWQDEFSVARKLGFGYIEWLWDWRDWSENPILSAKGVEEIKRTIKETKLPVKSLCADYYMKHALYGRDAKKSILYLRKLILNASEVGIKSIAIPFLEELAIHDKNVKKEIASNLRKILPLAEENGININFETEMNSGEALEFVTLLDSKNTGICYDLGNAVSYGFNPVEDIDILAEIIGEIHLKDRKIGSSKSVPFGQGDVDFKACLNSLKRRGFRGPITIQAWRGDDYLKDAKDQLSFINKLI